MKKTFYCKIHTSSENFSIDEWNEVQRSLELTNLSEKEKQDVLFPPVCQKQCFDCITEVGEKRLSTQKLIDKMNLKHKK